jgi:type II secretory pathway pseudopilin PulG
MTESKRRKIGVGMLLALLNAFAIIGVLVLGVALLQQSERATQAEAAAAAEAEQRDAEAAERGEAIEALREQVLELGEEPVVEPLPESSSPTVIKGQDGKDAPPPTAEQMVTAVQQCFAVGLCTVPPPEKGDKGDKGDPGNDGTPGQDSTVPGPAGLGIQTIECMSDGAWRFTMTDGTARDVPGPCRALPISEPTPAPTPAPTP